LRSLTNIEKVLKVKCEKDFLFFTRYIYKENQRRNFIIAPHFVVIAKALEKVYNGKTKRLIINIPPRYGKTELAVKCFIAWSLAKNPQSKFIHLSYSSDLALDNSSQTKQYIESDAFQSLWEMQLKQDAKGKQKWFNTDGGGVYATSSGGAITGFGAGVAESKEFAGCILMDDMLKPDDAGSDVKRSFINQRYNSTIRSRVNDRDTPIILVAQRLHEEDLSGFLLNGGSGEEWEHLCLPALNELNEPRWEDKHNFAGQYMQTPSPEDGGEWRKEWFRIVDKSEIPLQSLKWELIIDGAYTKDTKNDPSGFQIGAKWNNDYVILSSIDKYLEMPELLKFIPNHISSSGVDVKMTLVEPKASGKSLVQIIRQQTNINISEIKTIFVNSSKIENARACSHFIEGGRVILVKGAWNEPFLHQIAVFPNGKHDEHIDLTCYGIERNLISNNFFTF
jgi:predicted phage terminase large subunit-like protein